MSRPLKYMLLIAIIGLLGYKSIYFEKLSKVKNSANAGFNPVDFSKKLWEEKFPAKLDSAIALPLLIESLRHNKEEAFNKYSNSLGIGNYRYSLVKIRTTVTAVNSDDIIITTIAGDSTIEMILATEFIYGNAVRDASGLVAIEDFPNTSDLNSISEELNKIIRSTVLPDFKKQVKTGDNLDIIAAVEINREHIKWSGLELLPVRIQIIR